MVAKLIRTANSVLYGPPRQVGRLRERDFDLDSKGLNTLLSEMERRAPEAARLYELEDPQKLAPLWGW